VRSARPVEVANNLNALKRVYFPAGASLGGPLGGVCAGTISTLPSLAANGLVLTHVIIDIFTNPNQECQCIEKQGKDEELGVIS
jgi:hypothetical protein